MPATSQWDRMNFSQFLGMIQAGNMELDGT